MQSGLFWRTRSNVTNDFITLIDWRARNIHDQPMAIFTEFRILTRWCVWIHQKKCIACAIFSIPCKRWLVSYLSRCQYITQIGRHTTRIQNLNRWNYMRQKKINLLIKLMKWELRIPLNTHLLSFLVQLVSSREQLDCLKMLSPLPTECNYTQQQTKILKQFFSWSLPCFIDYNKKKLRENFTK